MSIELAKAHRFTIRTMLRRELSLALEWAAQEGWNPGIHDAEGFYAADPNGFLIGELGREPVGCISKVAYGQEFGFLGFYLVRPEFRGHNYGMALWNEAIASLGHRCLGLDGVVAQQANYAKSGFQFAHNNYRYRGIGGETPVGRTVPLSEIPFEQVLEYDRGMFPAPRTQFLKAWLSQPDSRAFGVIEKKRLAGYGVIRPCREGHKIGPLFADSPEIAEALYTHLVSDFPGENVYLDLPAPNPEALKLALSHGMEKCFETARMYQGGFPALDLDRIYGITSFELG